MSSSLPKKIAVNIVIQTDIAKFYKLFFGSDSTCWVVRVTQKEQTRSFIFCLVSKIVKINQKATIMLNQVTVYKVIPKMFSRMLKVGVAWRKS